MFFENFRIALGLKKEQLGNICLHEDLVNTQHEQPTSKKFDCGKCLFLEQDSGWTFEKKSPQKTNYCFLQSVTNFCQL